jgi:hypothetical protein
MAEAKEIMRGIPKKGLILPSLKVPISEMKIASLMRKP